MTPPLKRRHHNDIYNRLVESDDDLIGMIAYSLYKNDKLEYCRKTIAHKGKFSERDLIAFYNSYSEKRCQERRMKANSMLLNFLEKAFQSKKDTLINESFGNLLLDLNNRNTLLSEQISQLQKSLENTEKYELKAEQKFWSKNFAIGILQSFLGTILWLFIVFLILQNYAKSDAVGTAKELFLGDKPKNVSITEGEIPMKKVR